MKRDVFALIVRENTDTLEYHDIMVCDTVVIVKNTVSILNSLVLFFILFKK